MTEIGVRAATKRFDDHVVLRDVTLRILPGSITAVLGSSGSGKTTLLRAIAGFERLDSGTIRIGGTVVDGPGAWVDARRRGVGYVPQDNALFPHLTAIANIAFGLPRS